MFGNYSLNQKSHRTHRHFQGSFHRTGSETPHRKRISLLQDETCTGNKPVFRAFDAVNNCSQEFAVK